MAAKFTPGPWMVEPHSDRDETVSVVANHVQRGDGIKMADWIADCDSGVGTQMSHEEYETAMDTMEANARLISAAPEMYHALKEIADRALIDDRSIGEEAYDMLRELRALLSRIDGEEGGHE